MFQELWKYHSGKLVGGLLGFLLGMFILWLGFFQTLFLLFCVIVGYVIGKRIDEKEDIADILDKLLPPGYR
ncbi:hypothetical protein ALO_11949 [Acetonema longum DSM 6540]|uniref:Small integral membrane protein n=1 Tax=Acetonema longum DSM 6540 TaxID=1009370 RepID=F7NJY0_9FIRM|nr:hypothetical protein ALO_11949 [Acetonema longum DSM 6540]